ncbi:transcriptional regulatory protein pro-1 [Favolaschia claudopus]|uniref:Transcriptional regulatory protein pro-1 n=1 Tax=Favolaschia claudopus TaxID=2862362 RepID=A0AAW0BQ26_9AGAR
MSPPTHPKAGGSAVRSKSGCYTCRIRRKKCDEHQNEQGQCDTCVRLRIECLGFGAKRPEWLQDPTRVNGVRDKIRSFLASQGMIGGPGGAFHYGPDLSEQLLLNEGTTSSSSQTPPPPTSTLSPTDLAGRELPKADAPSFYSDSSHHMSVSLSPNDSAESAWCNLPSFISDNSSSQLDSTGLSADQQNSSVRQPILRQNHEFIVDRFGTTQNSLTIGGPLSSEIDPVILSLADDVFSDRGHPQQSAAKHLSMINEDKTPLYFIINRLGSSESSFTDNGPFAHEAELAFGGLSVSIHQSLDAVQWINDNWDIDLLTLIRKEGCGGPIASMISPVEPSLTLFGRYEDGRVEAMAEALASCSGFPVMIQPQENDPTLHLLSHHSGANSSNIYSGNVEGGSPGNGPHGRDVSSEPAGGYRQHIPGGAGNGNRNNGSGAPDPAGPGTNPGLNTAEPLPRNVFMGAAGGGGGGGGGGEPSTAKDIWQSPLHDTHIGLRLKISANLTYGINFDYTFKASQNNAQQTDLTEINSSSIRPLSQPEVFAFIEFKIETRPRETHVDRSYGSIGLLSHRKQSIFSRKFLPCGFDLPEQIYTHGEHRQYQHGLKGSAGFSQGSPLATMSASYNWNSEMTWSATDNKVMPKCRIDHENGDRWDNEDRSYTSYNIAYQPQTAQFNFRDRPAMPASSLEMKVGMGINLRPAGSKTPIPKISFVNRHQVLVWVFDPSLRPQIRGILVLVSSLLDNIKTEEQLSIYEERDIELGKAAGLPSPHTVEDDKPGTIALSVAQVEKPTSHVSTKFRPFVKALSKRNRSAAKTLLQDVPPQEYLARGWDAYNNEWRTVLWPTLDQDFRAADPENTPKVWQIQCPWKTVKSP